MFGDRLLVRVFASEELCVFFCSARRWGKAVAVQGTSARSKARKRTGNRPEIERKSPKIDRKATQLAPGGPRGDLERFGGLRGCSRDAPGDTREALGTAPDRLGTPPEDPGTSRSDPKVRPGDPEGTFLSVLFGQSVARRCRSDFRTISGRSEACLTAQAQCFVRVGRFSSERPADRQIERKATRERPQDGPRSRQTARKSGQANEAGAQGLSKAPFERKSRESCARRSERRAIWGGAPPRPPNPLAGIFVRI